MAGNGQYRPFGMSLDPGDTELIAVDSEGRIIVSNAVNIVPPYAFGGTPGLPAPAECAFVGGVGPTGNLAPLNMNAAGELSVSLGPGPLGIRCETVAGVSPSSTYLAQVGALSTSGTIERLRMLGDNALKCGTNAAGAAYATGQALSLSGGVLNPSGIPTAGQATQPISIDGNGDVRVAVSNFQPEEALAKETENFASITSLRKLVGVEFVGDGRPGYPGAPGEVTHLQLGQTGGLRVETHRDSTAAAPGSDGVTLGAGVTDTRYGTLGNRFLKDGEVHRLSVDPATGELMASDRPHGFDLEAHGLVYSMPPYLQSIRWYDSRGNSGNVGVTWPSMYADITAQLNSGAGPLFQYTGTSIRYAAPDSTLQYLEATDGGGNVYLLLDRGAKPGVDLGRPKATPTALYTDAALGLDVPVVPAGVFRADTIADIPGVPNRNADVMHTDALGRLYVTTGPAYFGPTSPTSDMAPLAAGINDSSVVTPGMVSPLRVNTSGELRVAAAPLPSISGAGVTTFAASTASQLVAPANPARKSLSVTNTGPGRVKLRYANPASATLYKVDMPPDSYWEMPSLWLGDIHAVCTLTTGSILVGEEF